MIELEEHDFGGDHDYVCEDAAAAAAASVDLAAVNELLAARVAAKLSHDFETADTLREELRAVHGVKVFDKELTWGLGSRGGGRQTSDRLMARDGHDYRCTNRAAVAEGDVDVVAVDALLAERLQAKVQTKANTLSFELKSCVLSSAACRDPSQAVLDHVQLFGPESPRARPSFGRTPNGRNLEDATPSGGDRGQRQHRRAPSPRSLS